MRAVVPTALVRSTIEAAHQLAAGRMSAAAVSTAVANLLGETLRTMTLTRWTISALLAHSRAGQSECVYRPPQTSLNVLSPRCAPNGM